MGSKTRFNIGEYKKLRKEIERKREPMVARRRDADAKKSKELLSAVRHGHIKFDRAAREAEKMFTDGSKNEQADRHMDFIDRARHAARGK